MISLRISLLLLSRSISCIYLHSVYRLRSTAVYCTLASIDMSTTDSSNDVAIMTMPFPHVNSIYAQRYTKCILEVAATRIKQPTWMLMHSETAQAAAATAAPIDFGNVKRCLEQYYSCMHTKALAAGNALFDPIIILSELCQYDPFTSEAIHTYYFYDDNTRKHADAINYLRASLGLHALELRSLDISSLNNIDSKISDTQEILPVREEIPIPSFRKVVVAGTFDHLHGGHKVLLTAAALLAKDELLCAVTDSVLLKKKKHVNMLQDLETRIETARTFLNIIKHGLVIDMVTISDVYGPAAVDNELEAIVVSEETVPGAVAINEKRTENGLLPLSINVVDFVSDSSADIDGKLSSTTIRKRLSQQEDKKIT